LGGVAPGQAILGGVRISIGERSKMEAPGIIREEFAEFQKRVDSNFSAVSKRMDDNFSAINKRIDDNFLVVNKRIDDLRNDLDHLRDDMNQRLDHLRDDMNQRFKTLTWVITGWFSFLALLIVVFKFLRF